jgi:hypothetical protein
MLAQWAQQKKRPSAHTVADDLDVAVLAGRGEGVDCALEAVERVRVAPGHPDLEGLVVRYTWRMHALRPSLRKLGRPKAVGDLNVGLAVRAPSDRNVSHYSGVR